MNLWIETARDSLVAAIGEVDCLLLNDAEMRDAHRRAEPRPRGARESMELGPRVVVAKRGEYGAALFTADGSFAIPGLRSRTCATRPAPATASPAASSAISTGPRRRRAPTTRALRRAMAYGSVMASFNVEDFGTERVRR